VEEHHLRHRSASGGSLVNLFDWDWTDRAIIAAIQVASAPIVHVVIKVKPVSRHVRQRLARGVAH
jgi:hypothetical protein